MSKLTVELPESLQRTIRALAEQEGYSVDQFLATAAAEKIAAIRTVEYLRREAAAGQRQDFEQFLAAVPHRQPSDTDRIPD
jgi:hypothetical protein